ncbi:uncharacterized protein LOC143635248 isoform X2 [Bidens hawaiensis]|uniref:uncharacterized protein LOC143635248 isoform X2 n=1 Tax=Bidens hawaiensis TaxID=980011 RepID=UPI0040497F7A
MWGRSGTTQELDHSPSVPDNTVSSIHVEKDDRDQVKSGELEEDTKMEHANSAFEQTSEHGPQSSGPGSTIQPKEDDVAGFHDDGGVKLPHKSGDSEFIPASLTQLAKALKLLSEDELKFVLAAREAVNDGDMKRDPAELPERLKEQLYINNFEKELTYLQLCEEWDVWKKIDSEKSSLSTSLRDVEGKNKVFSEELAACQSELDRVRGEMETLQIELKRSEDELSNVSSELVDSRNLLSELQLKQENLSVNVFSLTEEKHSLEKEKEDLNMDNEKFKKELMECKSLLELSQAENVNFKESLAKLEEEKEKYVSEYEHFVNENKKFSMELTESQDLVESLCSEIAKLNENLELVTKEETRLGEEVNRLIVEKEQALAELTNCQSLLELSQAETANLNEQFAHSSTKVSMELSESQLLVEGLQEKIAKLSESLDLVTKEKTRLEEEVNHLTVEKEEKEGFAKETKKFSLELLESQELVESLRSEIAKLNDNLELVTKEETRLGEEVKQLTTEKEEALTELTNCKSLLELSHAETANLNEQFAQSSKKVSLELSESQLLVEGLQEKIAKLSESLDLVTKEKTKLEEEVNHLAVEKEEKEGFVKETKKFSLELLESKELVESLRSEIAKLNENLELVAKEETRLGEEVKQLTIEKEAALTELTNCRSLLELSHAETASLNEQFAQSSKEVPLEFSESQQLVERLHAEIAKSSANLDLLTKEKSRLVEEVNRLTVEVEEKDKKFSLELSESQDLVEGLRSEIAKLKENLESVTQEETRLGEEVKQLIFEKEEALTELTNCKSMLELSHAENANLNEQFALSSKEVALEYVESQHLVESLHAEIAKSSENLDLVTKEKTRLGDEVNCLAVEKEMKEDVVKEIKKLSMELLESKELVESLRSEIANLNENAELATKEETRLREEMNQLTVEKEEALTELTNFRYLLELSHAENAKLNEQFVHSSKEVSLELSESQQLVERLQAEIAKLSENLDLVTKEKIRVGEEVNRLTVEKEEALAELTNCKTLINDLQVEYEETFLQKAILDEYVKQYVFTVEGKKGELVTLCENLRQEVITSRTKSSELTEKLFNTESRIQELQEQVDELQQQADHMTETNKDLESTNELASYVIHKVFDNLQKLVEDLGPATEQSEDDTAREQLDHLEISNYDVFIERQIMVLRERAQLESKNRAYNLEILRRMKDLEALNKRCINPDAIFKFFEDIQSSVTLLNIEIKPDEPLSSLESIIHFLIKNLKNNETKVIDLQNEIDHLTSSIVSYEIQSHVLEGSLITAMEQIVNLQSDTQLKETELGQSEQRVSALREKLHIAVTKGKGLIQQRESLKQNLASTSSELEKCLHELQLKDATLQETEAKLRTYSEAGERMEALESELSYIRNSATALRESFLLKDSVLQRIEEILEDLDLPEDFHDRDIIDKIDWLAKSVSQSQNSFPASNQPGTIERTRSYPESGSRDLDGWREVLEPSSGLDDELRRNYEELQNKFYGLAEQNEMLEQSLMERNNLVQRWEEVLDKINMPSQFRSLEPEDRIEWLRVALLESNDRCALLQQDISELEQTRESLAADLEESQRRLVDIESTLKAVTDEREQLSASCEAQGRDYNEISEKAALYKTENEKLKIEVDTLHSKLDEKCVDEEQIHHIHGEIRRLQGFVKEMLQVSEIEDLVSNTSDIQCLEGLLKKLADKHITQYEERSLDQSNMQEELERKLEAVEGDLVQVKDERERLVEKSQTLTNEIEALEVKNQELKNLLVQEEQNTAAVKDELERKLEAVEGDLEQAKDERERLVEKIQTLTTEVEALELKNQELKNLLVQEEQKTATVKEKLNVAVRKGKSLVQVRDSMKQTINDLTSQVERLNGEIKARENTILEFQQKMQDLFVSQEVVENKDSEIQSLKNRLYESENELVDKRKTVSMILGALSEIELGVDSRTNDPFEQMKQIEQVIQDLQAATASAEQDSRKSKRAAELLLAELNEVQERNEDLLEEISELSRQRDSAEASKRESQTRFEQLSALHSEERSSQFSELVNLKSGLEQLTPGLSKISNLLNNVLPKDLDYLYNLEAGVKSLLESGDASNVGGQTLKTSRSESKFKSFLDSKTEELHNDSTIIDLWRFVGSHVQDLIINITSLEEKLQNHSKSLHEEAIHLCETVPTLFKEITSQKHSIESANEEIAWLESTGKQKETEILMLRKNISILYEACKNSVLEIEKSKGQMVADDSFVEDIIGGETVSVSEEGVTSITNRLLSAVKDIHSAQTENVEVELKEMKATISNLQKELTEKDVQKDRISVELVSQIKRAEATAMSHLQELESAKAHIEDLKDQYNVLEQRVKELKGQESVLVDLQEKVKSLTEAMTAKEQENEALLQALDEEEAQMEDLTNKITELEQVVKQKNLDLESAESARGKALKKLSVTVSKFDELHHLSETLVSEVDKLQSQLQERDSEISFLRDEITRITSESLQTLKTDERGLTEFQDILTWLDSMASGVETRDVNLDDNKNDQVQEYKEILKKQITNIISELKDTSQVAQIKDVQLHAERSKVDELARSLREKETRLTFHENEGSSTQQTSVTSEIVEVEPLLNKWPSQGTSVAPQVRSLRKVNNDQLAISIDDVDSDDRDKLDDDDDDKAHGFKSLATSKLVPRFTRPVTDFVDGLWVSCDRTLMRQPALRLSLILYWALIHALLAVFVV